MSVISGRGVEPDRRLNYALDQGVATVRARCAVTSCADKRNAARPSVVAWELSACSASCRMRPIRSSVRMTPIIGNQPLRSASTMVRMLGNCAVPAYGAAYTLQEMLTVKSDDVQ